MKISRLIGGLTLAAALLAPLGARAHCGKCGVGDDHDSKAAAGDKKHAKHDCKDGSCPLHAAGGGCPAHVEGAAITVANTADGATITIKGKDAGAVKKIQEAAAKMGKGECCAGHGKGHEHGHGGKDKKKS